MGHLATAKAQGHLDLVAFLQELHHGSHLDIIVMGIGSRTELDFLDLDDLLLLAGLGLALLLFVLELAQVHDLADRRGRVGRDFDQIQPGVLRHLQPDRGRNHADILSIGADQADFGHADAFVHAGSSITGGRCVMRSAGYGCAPLIAKSE